MSTSITKLNRKLSTATAVMALLMAGAVPNTADAADDLFTETTRVEFGTGWYIRGELGGGFENSQSSVGSTGTAGNAADFGTPVSLGIGGGYRINNFLRGEMNLNQFNGLGYAATAGYSCGTYERQVERQFPVTTVLADGTVVTNTETRTVTETVNDQGSCFTNWQADVSASTIMGNIYVDGPTFAGFTPYVGGGLGMAIVTWNEFQDFDICRGSNSLDCQENGAGVHTYREGEANTQTDFSLAYSLALGFSYDLTQNAKLDIGYRYTNVGGTTVARASDNSLYTTDLETDDVEMHEVRFGIRYEIW